MPHKTLAELLSLWTINALALTHSLTRSPEPRWSVGWSEDGKLHKTIIVQFTQQTTKY